MKIEAINRTVLLVTFPDGQKREFSDKDALWNHLASQVKSRQNCIAHYKEEIKRLDAELASLLDLVALTVAVEET